MLIDHASGRAVPPPHVDSEELDDWMLEVDASHRQLVRDLTADADEEDETSLRMLNELTSPYEDYSRLRFRQAWRAAAKLAVAFSRENLME